MVSDVRVAAVLSVDVAGVVDCALQSELEWPMLETVLVLVRAPFLKIRRGKSSRLGVKVATSAVVASVVVNCRSLSCSGLSPSWDCPRDSQWRWCRRTPCPGC